MVLAKRINEQAFQSMPRYGMPDAGIAPYNNAALYDLMRRTTTLNPEPANLNPESIPISYKRNITLFTYNIRRNYG